MLVNTSLTLVSCCSDYVPLLLIPITADAILNSDLHIPLMGAAIGNGWIDARRQYPSYLDYAVKVGILEENSEVCPLDVSSGFRI